jgi:AraC-like DNA-binding protein
MRDAARTHLNSDTVPHVLLMDDKDPLQVWNMPADTLDRLLVTLAVRLHAFAVCKIKDGWRLRFAPMEGITIHYVLKGRGTIRADGKELRSFEPQTIMIVPARCEQSLGDHRNNAKEADAAENCTVIDDGLVTFTAGAGSRDLLVICGTISATYGGALGLFNNLHEPVVEDISREPLVRYAFEALSAEVTKPSVGTHALAESLMKQCLILMLRRHLLRKNIASPFFAALQDQRLTRAIIEVLERPAAKHTVDSLAAKAGMSRSSFAEQFTETFGEAPIEFVQRVRLRLGAQLLSTTDLPVKVIASSVGYSSRSYFSRAFRAAYGADPTAYRALGGYAEQEPLPIEGRGSAAASLKKTEEPSG